MTAKKKQSKSNQDSIEWAKIFRNLILFGGILLVAYLFMRYKVSPTQSVEPVTEQMILQRTWDNYYQTVDSLASDFNLNTSYLMALIVLECSGKKEFEPRFENHVYKQFLYAQENKKSFGTIPYSDFKNASDQALRNLSTSWGPFQLMGYQVIHMDIGLQDLRGKHNVYWGMYWINKRYGKYLRKKRYSNCFHMHNTGQFIPQNGEYLTYDPSYVKRGLAYMKYFQSRIDEENTEEEN
jgi:hypothetical protein